MATIKEKIGYGLGDMSSSMFWKIFSAYLPFFYSSIYGLSLEATGVLMLVTRVWDAVSDPMMGIIADRTRPRWGRYRPYLLWMAAPFAVAGVLLFTTPPLGETGKTVWAFATYILMMTVYTAINVPYGSMLAVVTEDSDEKTVFSSYRMFFAYLGSFLVLVSWEPLCQFFRQRFGMEAAPAWQWGMTVVAVCCLLLFLATFALTREHVQPTAGHTDVASDFRSLLRNAPWWILLGAVLFFNFFVAIRYAVIPFYFASFVPADAVLSFGPWSFVFYAGVFFSVGEVANMGGVATTPFFTRWVGKKLTFLGSLVLLIVLSAAFFFVPLTTGGLWTMMGLQVAISVLTGVVSPLVWSMYADIADYAELTFHTSSTGLIFSSSSMAQKFGGAIGAAAVMWILAGVGYDTHEGAVQTASALEGLRWIMSWLPAGVAGLSLVFILIYPLGSRRMADVARRLSAQRQRDALKDSAE